VRNTENYEAVSDDRINDRQGEKKTFQIKVVHINTLRTGDADLLFLTR